MKSVQIRSFFRSVFSCIRTEYRKIRTRKNSVFGHFSCSDRSEILIKTFWQFTVLDCRFNLPQIKQNLISSIKKLNELPYELPKPKDIKVIKKNLRNITKSQNQVGIQPSPHHPLYKLIFGISSQKITKKQVKQLSDLAHFG